MTIEKLMELNWKDLSIEIKKPEEMVYLTIKTKEYVLEIKANQKRFWVNSCYKK